MLIEYDLTTGQRGFIEVGSVVRVSVLSDGHGVVYTATGQMLVILEGERFVRQWTNSSPGGDRSNSD